MSVLTMTTSLLDVLAFADGDLPDGFLVGDLRGTDLAGDAVIVFKTGDVDIKLQLSYSRYYRLTGIGIGIEVEGRILFAELHEGCGHLIHVDSLDRLDSLGDQGILELDGL